MRYAANNREVPAMSVEEDEGEAVENWVRLDTLGLMQQLGAVPGH